MWLFWFLRRIQLQGFVDKSLGNEKTEHEVNNKVSNCKTDSGNQCLMLSWLRNELLSTYKTTREQCTAESTQQGAFTKWRCRISDWPDVSATQQVTMRTNRLPSQKCGKISDRARGVTWKSANQVNRVATRLWMWRVRWLLLWHPSPSRMRAQPYLSRWRGTRTQNREGGIRPWRPTVTGGAGLRGRYNSSHRS